MLVSCESRRPHIWNKGCCPRITCTMFRCRRLAATPSNLTFSYGTTRRFSAIAIPSITNEPFLQYAPGSSERVKVLAACTSARDECPDIPLVINGQAVRTGDIGRQVEMPRTLRACSLMIPIVSSACLSNCVDFCSGPAQPTRAHPVHLSPRFRVSGPYQIARCDHPYNALLLSSCFSITKRSAGR